MGFIPMVFITEFPAHALGPLEDAEALIYVKQSVYRNAIGVSKTMETVSTVEGMLVQHGVLFSTHVFGYGAQASLTFIWKSRMSLTAVVGDILFASDASPSFDVDLVCADCQHHDQKPDCVSIRRLCLRVQSVWRRMGYHRWRLARLCD
jgi:hypothetical protein